MIQRFLGIIGLICALVAPAFGQGYFAADNALSVYSVIWPNNTTAVQVCKNPCRIYQVDAFNNGASLDYVKLYNASTATCGVGTPQYRAVIPFGSSSSGGGFSLPVVNGDSYSAGAWLCITGAIGDSDTTAPSANQIIIDIHYKTVGQTPN